MTGDREYQFTFQAGRSTPPSSLFDSPEHVVAARKDEAVILFSGGLDSIAGVVERLRNSEDQLHLVSHRSGQPGTAKTQDELIRALRRDNPDRLRHYKFSCGLTGVRAVEETQRTRTFLYASIALGLTQAVGASGFYIFENGVTALNFSKRQDLLNARASRTTHPKTILLLKRLFALITEKPVEIWTPFRWHTKAEVFRTLVETGGEGLITSTVSCSRTFRRSPPATHCGGCSQCIDRRFAAYAAELDATDESGIYSLDIVRSQVDDREVQTGIVDHLRQALSFAESDADSFYQERLQELSDVIDHLPDRLEEAEAVQKVWDLCHRHGEQVLYAAKRMREIHDDLRHSLPRGSVLQVAASREYLKPAITRLVDNVRAALQRSIPTVFQTYNPHNEKDFNDKVSGIINAERQRFEREHPTVSFALANAVPDHSAIDEDLVLESKYIREGSPPSKAREGMAADLTTFKGMKHILFIVYDPTRAVHNDADFARDFELEHPCTVCIIR